MPAVILGMTHRHMPAGVHVTHVHMPAVILRLTCIVTTPHVCHGYHVPLQSSELSLKEGMYSVAEQTHV